ncbi:MAG: MarR family winged helix-turn-helix transcriptional regulator [Bacillota bacterium]
MTERQEELLELLHAVQRGMHEQIRDVLEAHRLPQAGMVVMRHVHHDQGITVSEISRRTGLVKSHISRTVDSLVELGLLEKRPDSSDQRLIRLYITEQASERFERMKTEIRKRLSAVVATLPDEKVKVIVDGLRALRSVLEQGGGGKA